MQLKQPLRQQHGKSLLRQEVQGRDLHPGNRVLLRNLTPRGGPGKIQPYWEDQVYKVKERKSGMAVPFMRSAQRMEKGGTEWFTETSCCLVTSYHPQRLSNHRKNSLGSSKERTKPQHQQPEQSDTSGDEYSGTYYLASQTWQRETTETNFTESLSSLSRVLSITKRMCHYNAKRMCHYNLRDLI